MGIFDVDYNFDELIRTTSAGIEVASFVQFKDAITKRYKEVFGTDIDVDSTTGDGQFIIMLALMLYNGYNGVYYLNQNIDPASAKGKFLDILCSFNNVERENASKSYAYLYVDYVGASVNGYVSTFGQSNVTTQKIECIDTSGKIWVWEEGKGTDDFGTKFYRRDNPKYQGPVLRKFVCEDYGEIAAKADDTLKNLKESKSFNYATDLTDDNRGDISKTVDISIYPFEVWQADDAILGNEEESDEDLRKRRLLEMGNTGVTVISGITGGILTIEGVEEVKLYNNVTHNSSPWLMANDGSRIYYHDVYFCLRYKENVDVDDSLIGKKIYEKMTPGIVTTPYNTMNTSSANTDYTLLNDGPYGITKKYLVSVYNQILKYNIYWKKCLPISPSLKLKFMYNPDIYDKTTANKKIEEAFKKYTKNLSIYDNLTIPNILYNLNISDEPINNQNTFIFLSGKICREDTNKTSLESDINNGYFVKTSPIKYNLYEKTTSGTYFNSIDTVFNDKTYYKKTGSNLYTLIKPNEFYDISTEEKYPATEAFNPEKNYYKKNTEGGEDSYDNKDTYFDYDNMIFEFSGDDEKTTTSISTYRQAELIVYTGQRNIRFYNLVLNNQGEYDANVITSFTLKDGGKLGEEQLNVLGITVNNYSTCKYYTDPSMSESSEIASNNFIETYTEGEGTETTTHIRGKYNFNKLESIYIKF